VPGKSERIGSMATRRAAVASWWQSWGKIVAVILGTIALVQSLNTYGPCTTEWKFQTIDAARKDKETNADEHNTIRAEIDMLATGVSELRGEVRAIRGDTRKILDAVTK